ncbi:MAG: tRNA guanosine(34) transglycosylase Tgt [Gemmatimonadetes bacterium]|nr:tRNA guanosine(34) transglycosylase Tgt [Gemmatimonadota bacterium]
MFRFAIHASDGRARAGTFHTPRGVVDTPVFMPVGTLATVKALDPDELRGMHAQIILANAYHLHLRPGDELVQRLGGLHRFMAWRGPILTDSGGFQVFSLASLNKVDEEGVTFRSHIDGSSRHFSPEGVMRIETNLGADVIMQFDHVIPGQSEHAAARDASERSIRWLARCRDEFQRLHALPDAPQQTLFPIVQGGIHQDLRRAAARTIADMGGWDGYAIGGLSVGEAKPDMYAMIETCDDALPADRPRYLMGVGYPEDLLEGVARGVDLFDCVAPTRMGRNAAALTPDGRVNMRRAEFREDDRPVVEGCACGCCRRFSRAYIRHLIQADEMLGARLLSQHNVHFLIALMREARSRIVAGTFASWSREWLARYHSQPTSP